MKHEQQIFATDCCENCLLYILYCALASSAPGNIAITVMNRLCSLQQIYPLIENKDADPVHVLARDHIYISIHIKVSVFNYSSKEATTL
jgi:hypothetical protein